MNKLIIDGYLNNYGFCCKKKKLDIKIICILKKYFNVTPVLQYQDPDKIVSFDVFYEDDIYIVLPKFCIDIIIKLKPSDKINDIQYSSISFNINKYSYKKSVSDFNFTGSLRDHQKIIVDTIITKFNSPVSGGTERRMIPDKSINKPKGGLIKLSCGSGKTVLAIYLSHLLKLKTLIVVHQEFLLDQWVERFAQFTNAKIGVIRQDIIDTENKDVVIAMLQSISVKEYDPKVFSQFGLVIYDEVHHLGSRVFSQALLKTSAEYTIGLSATPERSDGLLKIINWHVGEILYEMDKKYSYKVLVKKIYFRSTELLFKEKKRWIQGGIRPDNIKMIGNLMLVNSRNKLMIDIINTLKNHGRKIFVLSSRVDHLTTLKDGIDKIISDNGEGHIYNTYYYMGKSKKGERKMAEKDGDIIFATIQLAEEGLDISRLDSIIIALPIKKEKTLIQSIGRILRNDKLDNLTSVPLVIDISDILSIYSKWSKKRDAVYEKKDWYVQDYYWNDLNYVYNTGQSKDKTPMQIMFNDIIDEDFIEKNLIKSDETEKCDKKNKNKKDDKDEV